MGGLKNLFAAYLDEPRYVELVRKITEKTKLKKIKWMKSSTGMTAALPGGMQLSFVFGMNFFAPAGKGLDWQLFTIRGQNGQEILKVEKGGGIQAILAQGQQAPLQEVVSELFQAAQEGVADEVSKVIEILDKM